MEKFAFAFALCSLVGCADDPGYDCGCKDEGDLCGAGMSRVGASPPAGVCLRLDGDPGLSCACPGSRAPSCEQECDTSVPPPF